MSEMIISQQISDQDAMQLAYDQACLAQKNTEVPVGAIIIRDGIILGRGFNQSIQQHDPSAHAEIMALRQAGQQLKNYRLNGCTMYVTLEPCAMCCSAILNARIERLVFACWEPKTGAVVSTQKSLQHVSGRHAISWKVGVMQQDCEKLMQDFFKQQREYKT